MPQIRETLQKLLDLQLFNSTTDTWMDYIRNLEDSFYSATKKKEDQAAAEAQLEKVVEGRCLRKFSSNLGPIVESIRMFTESTWGEKFTEISDCYRSNCEFYLSHELGQNPKKITFMNPAQGGCGCTQVPGSDVWGVNYGSLGLKKIVICFADDMSFAKLFLVFKSLKYPDNNSTCTIEIGNDGDLMEHEQGDGISGMGGGVDYAMGFPGAFDYLAKHIGSLSPYITALSQKPTQTH